ncbi:MAG: RnfABCDGE type electron transport complex subunit E [Candidatus Aminicenantes bacterium]|nr:RnfABCDGE type electron transport complex subunit E [Candidatus Aminicenantes bacterium]NIM83915.1 RnfABCDGE type electron transport complex subunit E [Candidatus Aminicenantes bacterium]NIN23383.1 RnfABCDGE type electron transport complex subunit E [Candidatus Aminicenantes bacterium]NIN47085.1 RnfABCDGE type electron transport complex subunit E [Candidatus Aminicenantes bacterium]NIN90009.1 RnfABCDGE type electron transport complex subunit E [Candidatus Aminicenantes bacterium]
MNLGKEFVRGLIKENAVFVLLLGMCPTLAVTGTAINGMGMGIASAAVLVGSNFVIASIKNLIPNKVRIPAFIVVIASFVTIIDLTMEAYTPDLHVQLGIFIPLIVVNCVILGRAEAFASRNKLSASVVDGIVMGLGFTFALTLLGSVREILGLGSIFGIKLVSPDASTVLLFVLPPGAFIALGFLIAIVNRLQKSKA